MAHKKIKLEDRKDCPYCFGKTGIRFFERQQVKYVNNWGNFSVEASAVSTSPLTDTPSTVTCRDCGRRFELIKD